MGPGFKPGEGRFKLSLVGSIPTRFRQKIFKTEKTFPKEKNQKKIFFSYFLQNAVLLICYVIMHNRLIT